MNEEKANKQIALNLLNIISGLMGENSKTDLIKKKLKEDIRKEKQ